MSSRNTVWKIQHFSVTQILREITFGGFKSSKNAIFSNSVGLKFGFGKIEPLNVLKWQFLDL